MNLLVLTIFNILPFPLIAYKFSFIKEKDLDVGENNIRV